MEDVKRVNCEIIKVSDPNFPITDQAAKDVLVAVLYLKSVLNKTIADQDFKTEDMTPFGRAAYDNMSAPLGGDTT